MNKASSRIKKTSVKPIKPTKAKSRIKLNPIKKEAIKRNDSGIVFHSILKKYFNHLPTLFVGLILGGLTFYFLNHFSPNSVQHLLLPNTYLPFLILIFFSSLFLLSFIFLNKTVGYILSIIITAYLFLKLQQVIFEPWLLILLPFFLITLIILIKKNN